MSDTFKALSIRYDTLVKSFFPLFDAPLELFNFDIVQYHLVMRGQSR